MRGRSPRFSMLIRRMAQITNVNAFGHVASFLMRALKTKPITRLLLQPLHGFVFQLHNAHRMSSIQTRTRSTSPKPRMDSAPALARRSRIGFACAKSLRSNPLAFLAERGVSSLRHTSLRSQAWDGLTMHGQTPTATSKNADHPAPRRTASPQPHSPHTHRATSGRGRLAV